MEQLKQYPHLTISEIACLTGLSVEYLREEQLKFIRKFLKRNSKLWFTQNYGR